ncbi:MAG: hypothetical protein RLZZ624_736 [Cyanobacteriota bacterium]
MNRRWRIVGLGALVAPLALTVPVAIVGLKAVTGPRQHRETPKATRTLRYGDFIAAVQANDVSRVLIAPDRNTAELVGNDGHRAIVYLAPDKDLLKTLTDHNVDIAVQPSLDSPAWQQVASTLLRPLRWLLAPFWPGRG